MPPDAAPRSASFLIGAVSRFYQQSINVMDLYID